jgi:hypothetical protein
VTAARPTASGNVDRQVSRFRWRDTPRGVGVPADAVALRPGLPLALKLILLSLFLPEGLSFFIADLRLTATRLLFLLLTPVVFARFVGRITSGRFRFVASDLFVPLTALWMFVGPAVTYSLGDTLVHAGPVVMEYMIAYLATRVLLERDGQALTFASWLCIITALVALDGLLDPITGRYLTREFADTLTHYNKIWHVADEYRYGLLRAAGPIEHPILFGFACAIGFLIALVVPVRARLMCLACCGMGVVISFSSAPALAAMLGCGLLVYARVFRAVPFRWLLLSLLPLSLFVALEFTTQSPFGRLFEIVLIDPETAYFRMYIWRSVGPGILANPFFAVLPDTYDYEGSVDSVWLVLSLTSGIPCAVFTALSLIGACSLPVRPPAARLIPAEQRLGTALGIIVFLIIFMGFTVHFWGSVWILIGLLVGVRAHLGELGRWNRDTGALAGVAA